MGNVKVEKLNKGLVVIIAGLLILLAVVIFQFVPGFRVQQASAAANGGPINDATANGGAIEVPAHVIRQGYLNSFIANGGMQYRYSDSPIYSGSRDGFPGSKEVVFTSGSAPRRMKNRQTMSVTNLRVASFRDPGSSDQEEYYVSDASPLLK